MAPPQEKERSYLDRPVRLVSLAEGVLPPTISVSMIGLLISDAGTWPAVEALLKREPMGVVFGGELGSWTFDKAIDWFCAVPKRTVQHVMTYPVEFATPKDALEMLFFAAWPAEERWHLWSEYIVASDNGYSLPIITDAVDRFCDRPNGREDA